MDELDKFLDEIVEAKQLSGINDEVKAQLISDMKERLLDQINRALIEELSDENIDTLNQVIDEDPENQERIQGFLVESGVDVQKVTARTMLAFRDYYLQGENERG